MLLWPTEEAAALREDAAALREEAAAFTEEAAALREDAAALREEAAAFTEEAAALREEAAAAFTETAAFMAVAFMAVAVAFMAALPTTVLYRTDHLILGVGFVMIMTASSVNLLCSVTPRPGITTATTINDRYDDYTVAVQRALAQLGYYRCPVDGVVGPQTEKAIRWFQSVDRLPVTGEIDSATLRALRIG